MEEKKREVIHPGFLCAELSLRLSLAFATFFILVNHLAKTIISQFEIIEGEWIYVRYFAVMLTASSLAFRIYKIQSKRWNTFFSSTFATFIAVYCFRLFLNR